MARIDCAERKEIIVESKRTVEQLVFKAWLLGMHPEDVHHVLVNNGINGLSLEDLKRIFEYWTDRSGNC